MFTGGVRGILYISRQPCNNNNNNGMTPFYRYLPICLLLSQKRAACCPNKGPVRPDHILSLSLYRHTPKSRVASSFIPPHPPKVQRRQYRGHHTYYYPDRKVQSGLEQSPRIQSQSLRQSVPSRRRGRDYPTATMLMKRWTTLMAGLPLNMSETK